MDYAALAHAALEARKKAWAPYSHFLVGAALLCENGKIYTGCNIENAAYSPTICAERTAIFKAVSEGDRAFVALAVAGGAQGRVGLLSYISPCGICRQVLREFCQPDFAVVLVAGESEYTSFTLAQLLPASFSAQDYVGNDPTRGLSKTDFGKPYYS